MKLNKNHIFSLVLAIIVIASTIIFATGLRKNNLLTQEYLDSKSTTTVPTESSDKSSTSQTTSTTESTSSTTTSTESTSTSSTTPSTETTTTAMAENDPIVISVNDFIKQYDDSTLDTSLTYQFDAEPILQEDWGTGVDSIGYSIYINYSDSPNNDFIMFTSSAVANKIKNSKLVTFTVKIEASHNNYINPVRVISAVPK